MLKRILAWCGATVISILFFSPATFAQIEIDSPIVIEPQGRLYTDAELDLLLGPIALYPDPLLASLLPAATRPAEIVLAARFLNNSADPALIDDQSWSESVKAVAHYPEVLRWLDENLDWTTAVGNAFLNQPEAVMDTIQRLRAVAQSLGNLQTTPEQFIETVDDAIDILPAYPDVVYVPIYDPTVVYRRPQNASTGNYFRYVSRPAGAWLNRDWDWRNRCIFIWNKDSFRPQSWWSQPRADRLKVTHYLKQWCPPSNAGKYQSKFWAACAQAHRYGNGAGPHAPTHSQSPPAAAAPRTR